MSTSSYVLLMYNTWSKNSSNMCDFLLRWESCKHHTLIHAVNKQIYGSFNNTQTNYTQIDYFPTVTKQPYNFCISKEFILSVKCFNSVRTSRPHPGVPRYPAPPPPRSWQWYTPPLHCAVTAASTTISQGREKFLPLIQALVFRKTWAWRAFNPTRKRTRRAESRPFSGASR